MINPGMMISDRYEIIDRVGSGGMADVYKAKCHRLNRYVAIKVLKQEYSSDAKFVAKFRGEAQSVAGLSHPNIVNVYDVGEDNGLYYIVMELVEGITLKKFIEKKGRLDVKEAVGIGIQIAQGMEAAHNNHIIHRDIKPQNIIISKEGKVKVTDFGIAKAATSNTITSNAMGSVHYISPEQARGGYSDEKSDIYSLGVTLYEMLSGKVPFEGESTVTVALAHIQDEAVPLEELDPTIPLSLSKIVQKCMQKKPDMRYMSSAALISDLKRSLSEPDGDYVNIVDDEDDFSPTIKFSSDDVNNIKDAAKGRYTPEEQQEDQQDEEQSDDAIDPKLEKILKVCSIVVAAVIIIVIFLIIGKVCGWWGKSIKEDNNVTSVATEVPVEETPDVTETPKAGMVDVPDIKNRTLEEAQEMLGEKKLKWRLLPVESDETPNTVLEQDPEAGSSVEEYSRVTIKYSKGSSGVTIPDLVKYTKDDAIRKLESLGLSVSSTVAQYSDTVDEGLVCGTDPVVGSSVKSGSSVKLIVSKGPESDNVIMPNIVGIKEAVALDRLTARGLTGNTTNVSYIYSDKYAKGLVVGQAIEAGTKIPVGTVVDYTVSMGPKKANPTPTPKPTPEPTYSYEGSVTVSGNPFDYEEDEPEVIKLVLEQDGKSKTVYKGTLSYDDFPKKFSIKGWSENNGTVTLYKGDVATGNSYNVEFKKVRQ
ncbi:Stk1 family PASTA domain-containing Ser/Thr kinase [Eubacterium sp. MSJ-13]|uniref:Stk1 family PASTA domain-containing Ser/Thr kinase n=1 Tax=Eubacterium sp. MSJ-13 TaxID=2841513 RepID=UPI001C0F46C4|nr:Stk1 family PASTA domain-containing Ser/Thr kinase [Eubacterium sp. MSJ-13]MBU5479315.1 Stk1 family PASTA domain-containing Ser/Thr kinase [Eubacterium sp. MSJ-13]